MAQNFEIPEISCEKDKKNNGSFRCMSFYKMLDVCNEILGFKEKKKPFGWGRIGFLLHPAYVL